MIIICKTCRSSVNDYILLIRIVLINVCLRGYSGLTRRFRRVTSDFFLRRTYKFYYYLVYCYMFIDVSTIFTNFVNRKKLKSNAVDCFKVMVKKKHGITVPMIGLVLVIRNKK